MRILILNGSPKGKNSVTLYTALYLEKLHPEHQFEVLHVGQRIKSLEKDFSDAHRALREAELLLFVYPVYTFLAPYQLHRFIELMKTDGVDVSGKFASQITTSKHFYDVTAHAYIKENCLDMGLYYVEGLSADMEDLLEEKGRKQARDYFLQTLFFIENGMYEKPKRKTERQSRSYKRQLAVTEKTGNYTVALVTACEEDDENLRNMIDDFSAACKGTVKCVNIRNFPFAGGCLGCMACAADGKCVYHDGFEDLLRNEIQSCDAIVYAFKIENHYAHSCFKNYDDRQFCNGHRTVTEGTPVGYILSGAYSEERNLQMLLQSRSEVGGNFLAGIATDEEEPAIAIENLTKTIDCAIKNGWSRPKNFYGVGGTKIFRDLIYTMRGFMKADHKFYKAHGVYDFPQKQKKKALLMQFAGAMLSLPSAQKKMKGKMGEFMIAPYQKVLENAADTKR